jgi:DeoR/GlpR family transcriptional regulator of sugar metabolism
VLFWNQPNIELYMVGGSVGGNMPSTVGGEAAAWIENIRVEKAFIGVHGLNLDIGLTSVASPQMLVKKAILKAARETYVLADSSKFDNGYLSVICPVEAVHRIITDDGITPEDRKKAENKRLPLTVVDVNR